jgi:hypothetical protein
MDAQEMKKEIVRLRSENQVLKMIISETQKTLDMINDYSKCTSIDSVQDPFTTDTGDIQSVFGASYD